MALEGITRKELDAYLNGDLGEVNEAVGAPVEEPKEAQEEPFEFNPDEVPDGIDLDDIL